MLKGIDLIPEIRDNKSFYDYIKLYSDKHDLHVEVKPTKFCVVKNLGRCSGWSEGKVAVTAAYCDNAPEIFVHEFSHLVQEVRGTDISRRYWRKPFFGEFSWKDWSYVVCCLKMEWECEKISVQFLKEFNMLDLDSYTKRANLYLHFYHYVFIKGKWGFNYKKIRESNLYDFMPKTLKSENSLYQIDMNIMQKFDDVLK